MNALTNSAAYEANMKAKEMLNKKMQENTLGLKNEIQSAIDKAIENGEFKCQVYFYSKNLSKEDQKYIKEIYKEQGYKVKIKRYWDLDEYSTTNYNRKFILFWKQNK
jgi:hypothetical protein